MDSGSPREGGATHVTSPGGTTAGMLGTALMAFGALLSTLVVIWLIVNAASGLLQAGGFVLGLFVLAILAFPLIGGGWYLRGQAGREAAEAAAIGRRREVLDRDTGLRRQVMREIDQRLGTLEDLIGRLPPAQAAVLRRAARRLADVRGDLARPAYTAATWLSSGAGLMAEQLATARRYDDLLLAQTRRLADHEDTLERDPAAAGRYVESVEMLAQAATEREALLATGREAARLRPQELLAAARTPRRTPEAVSLSVNDALTYERRDYLVRARLDYFAGGRRWQMYQLSDGRDERWLSVRLEGSELAWLAADDRYDDAPAHEVTVDGERLALAEQGDATVSIDSAAGHQDGIHVTYRLYAGGTSRVVVEQWPDGPRSLAGQTIERDEIDLWTRPAAGE